jgi:hypothetical protein
MLIIYENDTYAFSVSLNSFFLIEIISWIFRRISSKKGIPHTILLFLHKPFSFLAIAVLKCIKINIQVYADFKSWSIKNMNCVKFLTTFFNCVFEILVFISFGLNGLIFNFFQTELSISILMVYIYFTNGSKVIKIQNWVHFSLNFIYEMDDNHLSVNIYHFWHYH